MNFITERNVVLHCTLFDAFKPSIAGLLAGWHWCVWCVIFTKNFSAHHFSLLSCKLAHYVTYDSLVPAIHYYHHSTIGDDSPFSFPFPFISLLRMYGLCVLQFSIYRYKRQDTKTI